MTRPTTDDYRRLMDELLAGIAARQQAEEALAALEAADGGSAERALGQALRELADRFEREWHETRERHIAAQQTIDDVYREGVASARAAYCGEVARIEEESAVEREKISNKYLENCWLMSSILGDDSENSPHRQFEKLKTQVTEVRERLSRQSTELTQLHEQALALVENRRQRVDDAPGPSALPTAREQALTGFNSSADVVHDQFGRLRAQVLPRLFSRGTLPLAAIAGWCVLFAAAWRVGDPAWLGWTTNRLHLEWLLVAGGAAFGVMSAVLLAAYSVAVHQTAAVFEPLQQALVDAQAHAQRWLKFAKEDLQAGEEEHRIRQAAVDARRERSAAKFAAARDAALADLETRRLFAIDEAAKRRELILREAAERHSQELVAAEAVHCGESTALRDRYEDDRRHLELGHGGLCAERRAQRGALDEQLVTGWARTLARLGRAVATLEDENQRHFPGWTGMAGPDWRAPDEIPPGIRIGEYVFDLAELPGGLPRDAGLAPSETAYALPAVLPFPVNPSLVLRADGGGRGPAVALLQTAMLRLLAQLPPGDVRFTIFDPVGLGENFAAFMHLADFDELLITSRIWTETAQIEQQLANITEHMENVFQKYLRNEFESIEEYNVRAGEVAEPYRVVVVANFPSNFSERAAQRLASIAASGARCGVFTLVSIDTRLPVPHGFNLADLEANATLLEWSDGHFVNRLIAPRGVRLLIDAPPAAPLVAALVRRAGELSKTVRRVEVPFHRIAPREEQWWSADSCEAIDVPLGRAGATKLQHLRLGTGTSQHVLIAGKTGSGKSTLLNVIITDLALRYSPDELELYLIDFKKGVEFKAYAAHRLPHARVIAIESDREFGTSTLERLDAVLKERGDLFREQGVQDIKSFRSARPDVPLPRILLIVDEFQEFFVEDDRHSQTAALLLDRLVRQGRAFGIHVLLGSQTLGGAYSLARTTIGQMAVRIALQCSEADAHLILSEENTAARLLTRPGEAIYNDANGRLEGNSLFQIAWLDDAQRDGLLARLRILAEERGGAWAEPVVFEGNVPADPSRNVALCRALSASFTSWEGVGESAARLGPSLAHPPAGGEVPETCRALSGPPPERTVIPSPPEGEGEISRIWLGDAVAITGPTAATFPRRSGANLLIVGQDSAAALGMLSSSFIALAASLHARRDEAARESCLLHLFAGGTAAARQKRWARVLDVLPEAVCVSRPNEAPGALGEIADEVARRRTDPSGAPPLFFVIDDLSQFRGLRKADDDFGLGAFDRDQPATPARMLAEVLRDGPAVGVHAVVWCDSYNNVDRWLGRQVLREFDLRVALQMSAADSSNLIDSPAASRLGTNRALLYSDALGTCEKFRPYGAPSDEWLARIDRDQRPAEPAPAPVVVPDDINLWVVT